MPLIKPPLCAVAFYNSPVISFISPFFFIFPQFIPNEYRPLSPIPEEEEWPTLIQTIASMDEISKDPLELCGETEYAKREFAKLMINLVENGFITLSTLQFLYFKTGDFFEAALTDAIKIASSRHLLDQSWKCTPLKPILQKQRKIQSIMGDDSESESDGDNGMMGTSAMAASTSKNNHFLANDRPSSPLDEMMQNAKHGNTNGDE